MSKGLKITLGDVEVHADLAESGLAEKIVAALPLTSTYHTWGDEIYFHIPVTHNLENPTLDLEKGDLAYWGQGQCFCIFYGPTPVSTGENPAPASEVEVFGKITSDLRFLKNADSDTVHVTED